MSERKKILLSLFFTALFLATLVGIYQFREELQIPVVLREKSSRSRALENKVECNVTAKIGTKDLRLKFLIPYQDLKEREELMKSMPAIKHELLMSGDRSQIAQAIEQRNFEGIRMYLLQVVNRFAARPIKELYFESFFFD